ncbi:hypothetical protein B9Q02_03020 [Candidatus Marsarchaeota G1 archaeon BE_D]|uniref:Calcineurin-like phosphoesterase domain-containing protein n=1 Tax=Candidatus Marsarchaeota G1 archaeon BE_D TaxID=1978156 RepID=A0A2R6AIS5_9ARCH|nr:MAG: hypothetical protein B9Q02_03020 [Candidatus Marsarchaeota G1 archaeon BE_D]
MIALAIFAHLSDLHVGGLTEKFLRKKEEETVNAFVEECLKEKVDFVLISGDLFDSNIPPLSEAIMLTKHLRALRDRGTRIYAIYGNHDYSALHSSMIELLAADGLLTLVEGAVKDPSGIVINGVHGRPGAKEVVLFERAENLEHKGSEPAVFMFHTAIYETGLIPRSEETIALSKLPQGYSYYAAGHIHKRLELKTKDGKPVNYPGPLFVGYGLGDLESYLKGEQRGFYFVQLERETLDFEYVPLRLLEGEYIEISAEGKSDADLCEQVCERVRQSASRLSKEALILVKIWGKLASGRRSSVIRRLSSLAKEVGVELKFNDRALLDPEEVVVERGEEFEKRALEALASSFPAKVSVEFVSSLIDTLGEEKREGETDADYEEKIKTQVLKKLEEATGESFELQD